MKNNNIKYRKVKVNVKNSIIEYDEAYVLDENNNEIFDRDIEIKNDYKLYEIYKRENNLLSAQEIKQIRKKYGLTQKEYAYVLGLGEITIHRFEKGAIQTEAVDAIMRLSIDPDNMEFLALLNRDNILEIYDKLILKIRDLQLFNKHILINENTIDRKINFNKSSVIVVAHNIIKKYNDRIDSLVKNYNINPEYITNLKLQKLLYYVQAMSLHFFKERAFDEKIYAWSYGPVVNEVYQIYKNNKSNAIIIDCCEDISDGLNEIIDLVVYYYGEIDANKLIEFTHEEEPWKNTCINKEIGIDLIKNYFDKIYN